MYRRKFYSANKSSHMLYEVMDQVIFQPFFKGKGNTRITNSASIPMPHLVVKVSGQMK